MRAQVSVEYMLVTAIIMMMVLPAAYLFYSYSQRSTEQISDSQLEKLGNEIINNAERVYYMGDPARITIQGRLPDKIQGIDASIDWDKGVNELVFVRQAGGKQSEYVYVSAVNINGSFFERDLSRGVKKIHLEAYTYERTEQIDGEDAVTRTPFVFINFGGRCPASKIYDLNSDCVVDITDFGVFRSCIGQVRTAGIWNKKWNTCMLADYDGNCSITADVPPGGDFAIFQQHFGDRVC
jgi:hypothetical protein